MLDEAALLRSEVVANAAMNRGRNLAGPNSYAKDLRLDVTGFLCERLKERQHVAWLDLCCGSGRALVQAAEWFQERRLSESVCLLGVDLMPMFDPGSEDFPSLRLETAPLPGWAPGRELDLVTCVHGL